MNPIDNSILERQMRWRYATKKFDSTRRIPQADWSTLMNSINLAPSSFGMQPWKFVVVEDAAMRVELRAAAWNQIQFTDSSHLLVLAAKRRVDSRDVDAWMSKIASVRSLPDASLASYKEMINSFVTRPGFDTESWATHQVYLALGILLASSAMLGIDACPMEGLESDRFDSLLGFTERGYSTKVACALGYRSSDDEYAGLAKVRFELGEVITTI